MLFDFSTNNFNKERYQNLMIILKLCIILQLEKDLTLIPCLVSQDKPNLFASTEAVMVEPLLPPQPTNIQPTLGTCLSVLKVYCVSTGLTV